MTKAKDERLYFWCERYIAALGGDLKIVATPERVLACIEDYAARLNEVHEESASQLHKIKYYLKDGSGDEVEPWRRIERLKDAAERLAVVDKTLDELGVPAEDEHGRRLSQGWRIRQMVTILAVERIKAASEPKPC